MALALDHGNPRELRVPAFRPESPMSIKSKKGYVPDTFDDLPPYGEETYPCWGCEKLFDFTDFTNGHEGLCSKCWKVVAPKKE